MNISIKSNFSLIVVKVIVNCTNITSRIKKTTLILSLLRHNACRDLCV